MNPKSSLDQTEWLRQVRTQADQLLVTIGSRADFDPEALASVKKIIETALAFLRVEK